MADLSMVTSTVDGAEGASGQLRKDDDFYLDDTFIVLKVDNTLFRLPVYKLKKGSTFFAKMFSSAEITPNGPENPMELGEDIEAQEFKLFLRLLLESNEEPSQRPVYKGQQWISVLKVSTILGSKYIRNLAIRKAEKEQPSPMTKIIWGRKHFISSWLRDGYAALIEREETITLLEADVIGFEASVKLFQLREKMREKTFEPINQASSAFGAFGQSAFGQPSRPPVPLQATPRHVPGDLVDEAFLNELAEIRAKESTY